MTMFGCRRDAEIPMASRLRDISFDCTDHHRIARFWADVLGYRVRPRESGETADDPARTLQEIRDAQGALTWTIMADPEGNEFCAFPPAR
jgi:hypothetical protein